MLGMSMSCGHRVECRPELSLQERAEMVQGHKLSLRLELIEAIRGFRYHPAGQCPTCGRQLTALEIIRGFKDDPHDFTTECTGCHKRFEPQLKHYSVVGNMELPFYCSVQALDQLGHLEALDPDVLQREHPAIYHSTIVHHGTLRNAFKKIGITYRYDEVVDWKTKVVPFLGRLPDNVIAQVVAVSPQTVSALRKKHGISRCTQESMLEEVWDADH